MVESFRRRRLPHWDVPHAAYFVTSCLTGSIPAEGWLDLEQYREELARRDRPSDVAEAEWRLRNSKLSFARLDSWLDDKPAVRHFADPRLAQIVVDAMHWFAGERSDLLAFVVMPSHIHWVFQPLEAWVETLDDVVKRTPRQRIQHSLNRHTARECNTVLGRTGAFWQRESYDHWVRDVEELERIIHYIEGKPGEGWALSIAGGMDVFVGPLPQAGGIGVR